MIRGLAKSGVVATEGMYVSNPSVIWPNHATLMTGTCDYPSIRRKMNATYVTPRAGIKPGAALENTSVAPTVAKLLGVPLKRASGTVLNKVLIQA